MNTRMMNKAVVVLAIGTALFAYAEQGAEDDAVLKALDAEISAIDDKNNSESVKETGESEEESIKPAPSRKRSVKSDWKPSADSAGEQQDRPRRRPSKDSKVVGVIVVGKGETKEEAKLAAFRAAVEKAVGVWVDAESMMQNSEMLKDRVNTISNADIKKYETIKEGRMKSGLYACQIKAWVEKKAITPKFADVFPAAFADVGEEASTIHVQKVTKAKRSGDAAALMTAALEDVDRMRNWVRLSVVKGKALEEVKKIKLPGRDVDVKEVPGKGLYSVRYSMKIDEDAYFKGFLPHFKEVLTKMQEGEAEEEVVLTSGSVDGLIADRDIIEVGDGRKLVKVEDFGIKSLPDLEPFIRYFRDVTYFVDPIGLTGFPGVQSGECRPSPNGRGIFMFAGELTKIQEMRTFNIWLLDRMNKDKTSVRCSAYKIPDSALRAYWKTLYGEVGSKFGNVPESLQGLKLGILNNQGRIEIVLLDERGEEISARIDSVPVIFLASGDLKVQEKRRSASSLWQSCNVFSSFFIRPMFGSKMGNNGFGYSTEIQRDVYFPLTDAQLERVKKVKVRFVGGKSKRK